MNGSIPDISNRDYQTNSGCRNNFMIRPAISIFIPAYNEEENIEGVVLEAERVLRQVSDRPEIIVVDDGSTDKTRIILDRLSTKVLSLKVIRHEQNRGIAAAMKSGIGAAKGDLIFFNSADKQAPMSVLFKMLARMDEYDLLVGCFCDRKDSRLRIILSKCYHLLIRTLFGIKLRNINALKLFRREIFDKDYDWGDNLCIDTEIVLRARAAGFRIGEVPLEHFPRLKGTSRVANIKNAASTFVNLFKLYFKARSEKFWSEGRPETERYRR